MTRNTVSLKNPEPKKSQINIFGSSSTGAVISQRTKDALALKKSQGQVLGKPVGTVQKSKFDKDASKIIELLDLGLSIRKIAKFLGYKNHISLNTYVNKRNLKDEV